MLRTVFLYTFLVTLLVSGCARSAAPAPAQTPTSAPLKSNLPELSGKWTIHLTHSGGIMGLLRSMEISSDGKFTVVDERAGKTVNGELSVENLAKLKKEVASSKYMQPIQPDGMVCADCFIYDLAIQGNDEKFAVQLNDISLPDSGLESLVDFLRNLIESSLK